jgi:hypothetical protein
VDDRQYGFTKEYTASENADLCALVLGIIRTKQFEDFDLEEMHDTLLTSPIFSGMIFSTRDLGRRITKMIHYFRVGSKGHLVRLREDNDSEWVTVTHPKELSLQELHIQDHSQGPYGDCTLPAVEIGYVPAASFRLFILTSEGP